MRKIPVPVTEKDFVALKVITEYETMKNVEYSKVVLDKVGILIELMNSLHSESVKVLPSQVWAEPLIYKLSFHSVNLLKLFEGTDIPFQNNGHEVKIMDKPSIIALTRVATENFLTFNYLYSDSIGELEKQFRLSVWRYCGIKQRLEFELTTENSKKKQQEEVKLLEELKNEIINSSFYQTFSPQQQKEILKGRKPRLFNSWVDLINQSGLRVRFFKKMYGYKSNYAHSEFISVFQVHSGNYRYDFNAALEIEQMLLHILICKAIIKLKNIFPTISTRYNLMDLKTILEIEFIDKFGSENYLKESK